MKKKKIFKKLGLIAASCLAFSTIAVTAVACSPFNTSENVFRYFYNTDILKDNNSPLNPTFNNAPISTNVRSVLYGLVTYETTDTVDELGKVQYSDSLVFEGATGVEVFKTEEQMKAYDSATDQKTRETNKPYTLNNQQAISTQADFTNIKKEGTIYRFKINTDNQWVDAKGNAKQPISGKDFERGIETYYLASSIGYNRNGYFLSLMGLDIEKTVGYQVDGKSVNVMDPTYDIDNFVQKDDTFTLYLKEPYPYTLDLLSKEYFLAVPHTNPQIKNIRLASNSFVGENNLPQTSYKSPIIMMKGSTGKWTINQFNTDFNSIYGSGDINNFATDVWYAGPYYISYFTSTKIYFDINNTYMDTVYSKYYFQNKNEKRIERIIETYGSGTVDTYYELFKTGQNDFLPSVPTSKRSDAIKTFLNKGLTQIKTSKLPQSNYITFTPKAYILEVNLEEDGNKKITILNNTNINDLEAKFINNWNGKNNTIIRAGLTGLINYYKLSLINIPSGDFQLSSVPFGNFDAGNYYDIVSKNDDFYGGLPRSYSDYVNAASGGDYLLNTSFEIPYYNYSNTNPSNNKVTIEKVEVSQKSFQGALTAIGATKNRPLTIMIKFGEGSFTANYTNYLNTLKSTVEELSGGLMKLDINTRNGSNPTANQWFNSQSSPMGFSYWSPDYNGVGTWLEASTLMQETEGYSAAPASNAHNSWLTYFSAMVSAVNLMSAEYKDVKSSDTTTSAKYYIIGNSSTNTDPYANDKKVQGAFKTENLKALFGSENQSNWETLTSLTGSESNNIKADDLPGIKYGKLAIEFLNFLIKNNLIDQTKFDAYVKNPSKLSTKDKPANPEELFIGHDVIKKDGDVDQSDLFSKWLGVFSGESNLQSLWATSVNDSDYSYIPRSETGLNEVSLSLISADFTARVSSVSSTSFRDFAYKR